ncbi:MAG: B3/4 domain-containing protein [Candidatus Heimdallarchaeota archaeon]
MWIKVDPDLHKDFPNLRALLCSVNSVKVGKESKELLAFKEQVVTEVQKAYDLDALRDLPIFRVYRDFFWRVGIDPTKIRPASEALVRRILSGKPIPRINTLVDAYNLASIKTEIAIAAFDRDKLEGELLLRYARTGELFYGIGWPEERKLRGGEIVTSDARKLVAIYPYRDADDSKITLQTKYVLLLICGVPGIEDQKLKEAAQVTIEYIKRFCGGIGKIGLIN